MSFTDFPLHPSILKAIDACGYTTPTPIQSQAIPMALTGNDLIATAQTGTGKTAAFVLPALQRITTPSAQRGKGPRVLVLTPTRELAGQVTDAVRSYGRFMRVKSGAILGGMPYREQLRLLSQSVDLLVATPGRLVDLLDRKALNLSRLELLVLDEADRMLDMGFTEDVDRIAAAAPSERQTLFFTATMDNATAKLGGRLLKEPKRIDIAPEKVTHDHIEQRLHVADDMRHKERMLQHLLTDPAMTKAIIFSATKRDAETLAQQLQAQGYPAAALHGDMKQFARNRTITSLRSGRVRLLVATDVAARGLDVSGISHVINFDLPKFAEDYVHRIGRTGRAGASGVAVSFASYNEKSYLDKIERYTGKALPVHVIPGLEPTRPFPRSGRSGENKPAFGKGPRRPFSAGGKRQDAGSSFQGRKKRSTHEPIIEYRRRSDSKG